MIEWKLTGWDGTDFVLPEALEWQLEYGLGSPCDSFWVKTLWTEGQENVLAKGMRMTVSRDGETVFFGVVDECQCDWSEQGCTAEISGRGMQALLLDNEAEAAEYGLATWEGILREYVTPFGIVLDETVTLPAVSGFAVSSGSSCWTVLYEFCRYYGGVSPRFDRSGRLCLGAFAGQALTLEKSAPVTRMVWKEQRYGVLSQVVVKDVSGWSREVVQNTEFLQQGGCASRVLLMPKTTGYQARRYNAGFQIDRSEARRRELEVTLALPFFAWPGDTLTLNNWGEGRNGVYRVLESRVTMGEDGCESRLTLGNPDAVL